MVLKGRGGQDARGKGSRETGSTFKKCVIGERICRVPMYFHYGGKKEKKSQGFCFAVRENNFR